MVDEKDDDFKVQFKQLGEDELVSTALVQKATSVMKQESQRSIQSISSSTWSSQSSFGTEEENDTVSLLKNQVSARQVISEAVSKQMTSTSSSHQAMMKQQFQKSISNLHHQTSLKSFEKQEVTNLRRIDESKEMISTSPIHLKVIASRNRTQVQHVRTVQEFRSNM